MDIAAALTASPPASPKTGSAASSPTPENGSAAGSAFSFAEEFENAATASELVAAGSAEAPEAPDETALPTDPALFIDVEDLTATAEPVEEAIEALAPQTEIGDAAAIETGAADAEPVEGAEVEIEVPAVAEAPGAPEDGEVPVAFAEADDQAPRPAGSDADLQTTPTAPVLAAAPMSAFPASAEAVTTASHDPADPAPEAGIEPEGPVLRATQEKPHQSHGVDRLHLQARRLRESAPEAPFAAMRAHSIEFTAGAASVKHDAVHLAPTVESAAVADQAIAAIRADRSAGTIDVRLDPPELGRLRIHFNMERADVVVATVSSERGETLDLLRRHSADLARELERAGFANVQLDFAAPGDGSFRGWDQPERASADFLPEAMADERLITFIRKTQGRLDRFV